MHLKREQITRIAEQVTRNLKEKGSAVYKVGADKIQAKVEEVIQKNIQEELNIETEVKRVMEQYRSQVASDNVDPQKIYTMIKKQVAKERKFIL